MAGFQYTVYRQVDGNRDTLAFWTNWDAVQDKWLWDLLRTGEATETGDGYPSIFRVKAKHAIPFLADPPPAEAVSVYGPVERCDPEEWLEIEGWDQG